MTLTKRLQIPPCVYLMLAKVRVKGRYFRRLSLQEVSQRSGLSKPIIRRIAHKSNFSKVQIAQVDAFIMGCGYDPLNQSRIKEHLHRIIKYKNGLKDVTYLRSTNNMPIWERAARFKHIKTLLETLKGIQ